MAADMRTRPGVARHGTDVAAGGTVPTRRGRAVVTNSKTLTIQKVIIITLQDLSCGLKKNPKLATLPPIESNRFHSKAVFIFRHTVVQKANNLSRGCWSKIPQVSIRNLPSDGKIPKISKKCRGKLRFLI